MKKKYLIAGILLILLFALESACAVQGGMQNRMGFWDYFTLSRVWLGFIFGIGGMVLLSRSLVSKGVRILSLLLALFFFGLFTPLFSGSFAQGLGMHPSPMCLVEKSIIFLLDQGRVPLRFLALLTSVAILTIIGNKLFCGWVCPVGALQELINEIPLSRKVKIRLPFILTNSVRILVFALFLIVLVSANISIYGYTNPFEFFQFRWVIWSVLTLAVTMIASLFIFRPFCYFLCPLGLVTWVLEQISIFRVKRDGDCISCDRCDTSTYCPAVPAVLKGKRIRPDCFSCGRCLRQCPKNVLKYKV